MEMGSLLEEFWESIEELWDDTRGDPRVCVAILDGPVDQSHQSLRGARLTQVESPLMTKPVGGIASQHGTHIASIIFGQHDGSLFQYKMILNAGSVFLT